MKQIHFEVINSTNTYLKENYTSLENFTFVSASFQNEGKGRLDRKWFSKKSENLLFSFLIKDRELLKKYKALSIGTATLVARFLEITRVIILYAIIPVAVRLLRVNFHTRQVGIAKRRNLVQHRHILSIVIQQ